ncbi:MAG: triacylglycerol lipase [Deltaproteobacteria bacterium]|nr:triacylglycerol lipase [Deltaproteobacteria bacterium]
MTWLLALGAVWAMSLLMLLTKVAHRFWLSLIWLSLLPHGVAVHGLLRQYLPAYATPFSVALVLSTMVFVALFLLHMPQYPLKLSRRIRIMMGGRRIFLVSLLAGLVNVPLCGLLLQPAFRAQVIDLPNETIIWDFVVTYSIIALCAYVGALRIFFTSRRLGVARRLLLILFAWVPLVNIGLGIWFCVIAKKEFVHDYLQTELQAERQSSEICATRYPLLLLHGVGFRDYDFLNYWGRIPALLKKNGATVFYGHQQAWGTIEDNAVEIQSALRGILAETGADKVNIIAHSKGGLDARYLISSLRMGPYVASLTTMSTPHHGSELLQVLDKLPMRIYLKVCGGLNAYFGAVGDHAPDAYAASRQLHPDFLRKFNEDNPDAPEVYYQSYGAQMKSPLSSSLLLAPYAIMKSVSTHNDGLVTIDSAKWGNYRGALQSTTVRGISHGDLIDLVRQDYDGFNMAEEYVKIVAELKNMGF